ncbi:hypothetical protein, partial [Salmonella enterica]|uniref:hypothetical protein n=1 Tax=Salmonella enterica TaxID=28901 RepID=UPI003010378B
TYPRTEKIQGGAQEEQPVLEMKKSSPFLRSLKPMLLGKKTKQNKTKQEERRTTVVNLPILQVFNCKGSSGGSTALNSACLGEIRSTAEPKLFQSYH